MVLQDSTAQALAATSVLLWLAGFAVVLAVDAALSGTDVVHLPAAPATVIVLVAVTAFVVVRFAAVRRIARHVPSSEPPRETPTPTSDPHACHGCRG